MGHSVGLPWPRGYRYQLLDCAHRMPLRSCRLGRRERGRLFSAAWQVAQRRAGCDGAYNGDGRVSEGSAERPEPIAYLSNLLLERKSTSFHLAHEDRRQRDVIVVVTPSVDIIAGRFK